MAREASHGYQPADLSERGRPREISIAETLQAQEDARQHYGAIVAQKREALFPLHLPARATSHERRVAIDRAVQDISERYAHTRKTPGQIRASVEQLADQTERLRQREQASGGGELLETAAYLAGELQMFGKNARVGETSKPDDYFNSVDFVIEWTVPTKDGRSDVVRLGVDFKLVGAKSDERKQEIQQQLEAGGPLRDLDYYISPSVPLDQQRDPMAVPIVAASVGGDALRRFYTDLVDPQTRTIRDVFDPRSQRALREEFVRNQFRGTLLNSLRENIGTQIQALENSKKIYRGNDFELRKIDRALHEIKAARDIIDLQKKELGIGDVIPFRTREQQEQETQEKSERTQINKKLDEQEKRIREFFKDFRSVFGATPEEYIASRQASAPSSRSNILLEGNYDPAVLKKITKRLPKESISAYDDQKEKQIRILLTKSPTANEKYLQTKQSLEAYRKSRPDLKESDAKIDARIEEYFRNDLIAESLVETLRSQAEASRVVA